MAYGGRKHLKETSNINIYICIVLVGIDSVILCVQSKNAMIAEIP